MQWRASVNGVSWANSYNANVRGTITESNGTSYVTTASAVSSDGIFWSSYGLLSGEIPSNGQMQFQSSGPGGTSAWSSWYNATFVMR